MNFIRKIVNPQRKEDEGFYYELKSLLNFSFTEYNNILKLFVSGFDF